MNHRKTPDAKQSAALDLVYDDAAKLREAQRQLWASVTAAKETGLSWSIIADCLGVSTQAAHERFTKPAPGTLV